MAVGAVRVSRVRQKLRAPEVLESKERYAKGSEACEVKSATTPCG